MPRPSSALLYNICKTENSSPSFAGVVILLPTMWEEDDSDESLTRSGKVLTTRRLSLRLKRKVALPEGGLRLGLGQDQVFSSDGEQESSTEE